MSRRATLQAARKAIRELDPQRADDLLHQFESAPFAASDDKDAIAQELLAIRELAAAALDGVAAAHEQLKQLLARAQTLDTYDKSGNRQMRDMSIQLARKF